MLLSHNFDLSPDILPALSRAEFTAVFAEGLSTDLQCCPIDHPHWIVEILFPTDKFSPAQVGELCAHALAAKRRDSLQDGHDRQLPAILILGGLKTTPATSSSPEALQPNQWGVDVVETLSAQAFLQAIAWEATIAQKPSDSIFKVELDHG
ncbi:MAG: DUF2656 domain-containing protein [Aphanocapsa sp. GSE-SYN-MK-11-07L]|jgi:hypothetical protein|nr:DUF2656 domain-containing protein [Aphanocapsa sp. GSE-SYN-MK-11-07L]